MTLEFTDENIKEIIEFQQPRSNRFLGRMRAPVACRKIGLFGHPAGEGGIGKMKG